MLGHFHHCDGSFEQAASEPSLLGKERFRY
jgi:hypothetical protein